MLALILMVNLMDDNNYLEHHGILGQRWGVRRYQNYDGSLKVAGKLKRSMYYKERASEAKKAANVATNDEDRANLTKKSEKYAAKSEKLRDQYERKYAKAYAKDLNKAKKVYDKSFNSMAKSLENRIGASADDNGKYGGIKKLISGKTVADLAGAALTRISYQNLRNKAVSEIPSYTNYALEVVGGKYRVRSKADAAMVADPSAIAAGTKPYTIKSRKGRVDLATTLAKTGLDVYDSAYVNKNYSKSQAKDRVSIAKNKADDRIAKAEAKAITIKAKAEAKSILNKLSGNNQQKQNSSGNNAKKVLKTAVNVANKSLKPALALSTAVAKIRGNDKNDKVNKILKTFGTVAMVAIPVTEITKAVTDNV